MKYVILLGDGMADYPIEKLGGKTPLEYAQTPNMDYIASQGTHGLVNTIPEGLTPASDVANLAILGYDAREYYTGRGALEAASMGVSLGREDVAFRCNLVTLDGQTEQVMSDFTAGQIASREAREIILDINRFIGNADFEFYPGVSFRHLMVWRGGKDKLITHPPHDIIGREIKAYLPRGEGEELLRKIIFQSQELIKDHPINETRRNEGKKPVSSIWLWGQGRKPEMKKLTSEYKIKGGMISAVDLLHGIAFYSGLRSIYVEGATDYTDTNYLGQGQKAIESLKYLDFVFVHVEAPDAMGHEGNLEGKIQAIEDFDKKVVGTVLRGMPALGPHRIMVASDHPTPVSLMTHISDPSPFAVLSSVEGENAKRGYAFGEKSARMSGVYISPGFKIFKIFMKSWSEFVRKRCDYG